MPDISKINALAIGSVSKVDGLAKASISTIDGITVPSATLLLDTYTNSTGAWSVRLLRTLYTGPCMRVRRISDDVEADVGFDSNNEFGLTSPISNTSDGLSYTDFADFVDHTGTPTDGMVRFWYDQSTEGRDAGMATKTRQCQIYDAVNGIIEDNGHPCIQPQAVNEFLDIDNTGVTVFDKTMFMVVRATQTLVSPLGGSNNSYVLIAHQNSTSTIIDQSVDGADYRLDGATYTTTTRGDLYDEVSPAPVLASVLIGRNIQQWTVLGSTFSSVSWYQCSEMVFFDDDEFTSGNLSGIESNIATNFGITI